MERSATSESLKRQYMPLTIWKFLNIHMFCVCVCVCVSAESEVGVFSGVGMHACASACTCTITCYCIVPQYISSLFIHAGLPLPLSCFDCSIKNKWQAFLAADSFNILFAYYSVSCQHFLPFLFLSQRFMILFCCFFPSMLISAQLMRVFRWKYLLVCFGS